ncbi:hypothetical protein C8R47DRAFT_1157968 [Mycena vitilis]|nr:hypothetical protein C8R47DRAFT_1157968 [Mycena vitilis]
MSKSQELVDARNAIASVTSGKDVNQDAWMTYWCATNWGELLQPAPLSIALLGGILIIASSTDDFSLDSKAPVGLPPFQWKYAVHPDSFQTCLQQMVGAGYTAFETADNDMQIIRNNATQMPEVIKTLVNLILKGSADDLKIHFQNNVEDLQGLSDRCRAAAHESEKAFHELSGLAQEMLLASTYTAGSTQKAIKQNETQLSVLEVQEKQEKEMLAAAKESAAMAKESLLKFEEDFREAIKNVPSGWDLMGMNFVENLTKALFAAGNAYLSEATKSRDGAKAGMNAFANDGTAAPQPASVATTSSPNGISSQPNSASLSDPGILLVESVQTLVIGIQSLLGGKGGKPDWDLIRGKDGSKSGAAFVEATLKALKGRLVVSKPISHQLSTFIEQALTIAAAINAVAGSAASGDDTALADQVAPTEILIANLESLVTSTTLLLQQPGVASTGPATPHTPATNSSAADLALQTAKSKVDQTRAQLEATRDSWEKASDRLVDQQKRITETISEITQLSLTNTSLATMLPWLRRAIASFTTLRGQFSQLVRFFDAIASLINDVMVPSVDRWVATIQGGEQQRLQGEKEEHLAGVTLSNFTRDTMYRQMMTPLKVAHLATEITTVYLEVSDKYILPAQRKVSTMLESVKLGGQDVLNAKLKQSQAELEETTTLASAEIAALVTKDQKNFRDRIDARLEAIITAIAAAAPALTRDVPDHVKEVTDAHVKDTDKTKELQEEENPMFNADDAMF